MTLYALLDKHMTVKDIRKLVGESRDWWRERGHKRLDELYQGEAGRSQSADSASGG